MLAIAVPKLDIKHARRRPCPENGHSKKKMRHSNGRNAPSNAPVGHWNPKMGQSNDFFTLPNAPRPRPRPKMRHQPHQIGHSPAHHPLPTRKLTSSQDTLGHSIPSSARNFISSVQLLYSMSRFETAIGRHPHSDRNWRVRIFPSRRSELTREPSTGHPECSVADREHSRVFCLPMIMHGDGSTVGATPFPASILSG